MAYTIQCAKCGHQNMLGRIFCTQCGQKLDFAQMDARGPMKSAPQPKQMVGRFVKVLVTLAIVGALVTILKPASTEGETGSLQDAQRLNQKLRSIKAAILDGKSVTQEITEMEINGYLAEVLKRQKDADAKEPKSPVSIRKINVDFTPDHIHVVMLAGIGPVTMSYSVVGKPAKKDGQFTIAPDSVHIGLMPLPPAAGSWIAGRIAFVFSNLKNEKTLLDQVSTMKVEANQIIVAVQGGH